MMYIPFMVVPLIGSIHSSAVPVTMSQHSPPTPQITPHGPGSESVSGAPPRPSSCRRFMPEESRREGSQEVSGLARAGLATAQAAPVPAANRRLWRAWHGVVMDDAIHTTRDVARTGLCECDVTTEWRGGAV